MTQMVTKTELYALDLSSFTATIESLDEQLRANREKLDDIAHAKEIISSNLQGQSAQAMISKLDTLEQRINTHMTAIQQTQAALTTYRTNKQQLQRNVIDYVDSVELDGFAVSNLWMIRPSDTMLAVLSPVYIGARFISAAIMQKRLTALVETFDRYDLQASLDSGSDVQPYTTSGGFSTIEPDRTIHWDNDFPHGSKAGEDTPEDHYNWWKWKAMLEIGARGIKNIPDAADFYAHFRDNTGTPMTFDYERAYEEDAGVRNRVNARVNESLQAANEAVTAGMTETTLYSPATSEGPYPSTENWRKTIGGHTNYTTTNVQVSGDTVTATVTVHARDRYNFDRGKADVDSGTPDAVNGRFEELGWAQSFDTSGSLTQTYTWKVGEQPPTLPTDTTENESGRRIGGRNR